MLCSQCKSHATSTTTTTNPTTTTTTTTIYSRSESTDTIPSIYTDDTESSITTNTTLITPYDIISSTRENKNDSGSKIVEEEILLDEMDEDDDDVDGDGNSTTEFHFQTFLESPNDQLLDVAEIGGGGDGGVVGGGGGGGGGYFDYGSSGDALGLKGNGTNDRRPFPQIPSMMMDIETARTIVAQSCTFERKQRRREQNRRAQQQYRARREAVLQTLQTKIQTQRAEISSLTELNRVLARHLENLNTSSTQHQHQHKKVDQGKSGGKKGLVGDGGGGGGGSRRASVD